MAIAGRGVGLSEVVMMPNGMLFRENGESSEMGIHDAIAADLLGG